MAHYASPGVTRLRWAFFAPSPVPRLPFEEAAGLVYHVQLFCQYHKNSVLPLAPRSGDSIRPLGIKPQSAA